MFFITFGGMGLCHWPSGSGILPELLLLGCCRTGGYGDSPASSWTEGSLVGEKTRSNLPS